MLNLFYSLTRWQQVGLIAFTTTVFFVFLSYISALIPPFIIAIFFSYLLNPVVDRIEFFSQKRILAVILLYIGILIGIIFFFNYFISFLFLLIIFLFLQIFLPCSRFLLCLLSDIFVIPILFHVSLILFIFFFFHLL